MIDRHLFAVFGATGDLGRRKLIPSLYHLLGRKDVAGRCVVLGMATRDMDDEAFRDMARAALADAGYDDEDARSWCASQLHYHRIGKGAAAYSDLAARIERIEADHDLPGNRAFYLALPPPVFPDVITGLGDAGLASGRGWTRLVVEKPFGHDLDSARRLNALVHRYFDESQVYRIDHYLGKETVQNLLVLRFANPFFERGWDRDHIDHVQITVAEDQGIGDRAGFYDKAGAMRDIVQNHLTQLLALVAMDAPVRFDAGEIRHEKLRALRAVRPPDPGDVVFGQYRTAAGAAGYRQEDGVPSDSRTETYVALRLHLDTWRWQGVPFYLRTGKRLRRRLTEIAVTFRPPPVCFFHGTRDACAEEPNVLVVTLQPDEGFDFLFEVKAPGTDSLNVRPQSLRFRYDEAFGALPDAYETLLYDVMEGDQTLFVHADEVETSWRLYDPILLDPPVVQGYDAGSEGPPGAEALPDADGREWRRIDPQGTR